MSGAKSVIWWVFFKNKIYLFIYLFIERLLCVCVNNLVFILHFNVMGNFNKCISHDDVLTKFGPFTQKCAHQSIFSV